MILLIQFFLAHIIGDFFLQPDAWVKDKEHKKFRSIFLYLHAVIHFVLLLLLTGNILFWKAENLFWKQILLITLLHLVIDGFKLQFQKPGTKRKWFFIDQLLHIISIIAIWAFAEKMPINWEALSDKKILIPVTAVIFLLRPASFIIRNVISQWTPDTIHATGTLTSSQPQLSTQQNAVESLKNAGQLIGILERLLVLVFILLDKWEGIGFLLAAKSVFRFGDLKEAKEMKLTEYVLIGTLLSFGLAIATGLITIRLLG